MITSTLLSAISLRALDTAAVVSDASGYDPGTISMALGRSGYAGVVRNEDGALTIAAALDPEAVRPEGGPGAALYAGSKGFVSTATKGLAKELVGKRIRVNAVSAGVIVTPFHEKFSTPEQLEGMRLTIPMGRLGTVDECVGAFIYFASEKLSGYVTGQILEVNGGQFMP